MLTSVLFLKMLRQILADYNYWSESESDSPLKISRSKLALTNEAIIARDAAMRRAVMKEAGTASYKAPMTQVQYKTLAEVFDPKIQLAIGEIKAANVPGMMVESLVAPAQQLEFLTQLYTAFKQLVNAKVAYVRDVATPPAPAPTIVVIQTENKVTATIENRPKGSTVQFAFVSGMGYELMKSDSSEPFDITIDRSALLRVDLVNADGYCLATKQLQVIYAAGNTIATPKSGSIGVAPLPLPAPAPFANDAYTGFFIIGDSTDGETIVASTLLVQT